MGDERVTPELFFRHYTSQRGISVADLGVQPLTVVTWMPSVARSLAEALGATAVADSYWGPEFAVGTAGGRQVSVARVPVGAPATAIVLEELIHCGPERSWAWVSPGALPSTLRWGRASSPPPR